MVRGRDETTGLVESMQLRWAHVTAVWAKSWLLDLERKEDGACDGMCGREWNGEAGGTS